MSYLNTKPFIYGLENSPIKDEIALTLDYPANLVKLLKSGQIDIGLVPVGALPGLGEYQIVSDYCIGTEGEVASVCLFSQVPVDQVRTVILDYQSRTSVNLCKVLFKHFWHREVDYIESIDDGYIEKIKDTTAALIIGDRALAFQGRSAYTYDLGLAWKQMTGLPFVFAVWVTNTTISALQLEQFNRALQSGLNNFEKLIENTEGGDPLLLKRYFTQNISYTLSAEKVKGMSKFLELF